MKGGKLWIRVDHKWVTVWGYSFIKVTERDTERCHSCFHAFSFLCLSIHFFLLRYFFFLSVLKLKTLYEISYRKYLLKDFFVSFVKVIEGDLKEKKKKKK